LLLRGRTRDATFPFFFRPGAESALFFLLSAGAEAVTRFPFFFPTPAYAERVAEKSSLPPKKGWGTLFSFFFLPPLRWVLT